MDMATPPFNNTHIFPSLDFFSSSLQLFMGCAYRQHAAGFSYVKPQSFEIDTVRFRADLIRELELHQLLISSS